MRHLPSCEVHVTDAHHDAWLALAEASAYIKQREKRDNATVISVSINLDDDADYYVDVVLEVC